MEEAAFEPGRPEARRRFRSIAELSSGFATPHRAFLARNVGRWTTPSLLRQPPERDDRGGTPARFRFLLRPLGVWRVVKGPRGRVSNPLRV